MGWPGGGLRAAGLAAGTAGRPRRPGFLGPTAADRLELAEARLAAEAEHARLARDLHDGIGHALTIITVQTAAGAGSSRPIRPRPPGRWPRPRRWPADALEELDSVLAALRDPGERTGPEPGVDRLPALLAAHREAGLAVIAEIDDLPALPPVVSGTVYRVVAEGLANAQRYAGTGDIILRVQGGPDAVRVLVDNPRPTTAIPAGDGRPRSGRRTRTGGGARRHRRGRAAGRPLAVVGDHPRRLAPRRESRGERASGCSWSTTSRWSAKGSG